MARIRLEIEDSAQRMTLKAILEAEGHTIGPDAPDLTFTDSIETAKSSPSKATTLMLATASEIPAAVRAMREGLRGYILVPLQAGEAALMIEQALSPQTQSATPEMAKDGPMRSLEQVELDYIKTVLRACKFNQARAARLLGIGRNTLWRKLKKDKQSTEGDPAL